MPTTENGVNAQSLVGSTIDGKYRIVRRLGGGSVADVYEAEHDLIRKQFAVKVLRREHVEDQGVAMRFLTEARAAGAVGHPGIVQVFDIGHLPTGEPYLVMELIDGENVAEVLDRRGRFEVREACAVCLHVLDALDAAHRVGVVHRDLKPENVVLVRGPDRQPWARIIDFGIARLAGEGPAALRATSVGTVLGTPYYMAPEQARGVRQIDGRADIYAVGVMLFEFVTARYPFEGATAVEILTKALSEPFPSPRTFEPSVPAELERIILRATARRREDRYATAAEFAAALRALLVELALTRLPTPAEEDEGADCTSFRRLRDLAAEVPPSHGIPTPRPDPLVGADWLRRPRPRISVAPVVGRTTEPPPVVRRVPRLLAAAAVTAVVGAAVALLLYGLLSYRSTRADGDALPIAAARPASARQAPPGAPPVRADEHGTPSAGPTIVPATHPPTVSSPIPAPAVVPSGLVPVAPPAVQASGAPGMPDAAPPGAMPREEASGAVAAMAVVRLVGLPRGARATVDGRAARAELELEVSDRWHVLRVEAAGRTPFVHRFRVAGDMSIAVVFPSAEPVPAAASPGPPDADLGPQSLANPFGGP